MIDHVGIRVRDVQKSKAFYEAALAPLGFGVVMELTAEQTGGDAGVGFGAGGADNGKPGPRPYYHAGYYGAFVLDPDGNNIEAVCHTAQR